MNKRQERALHIQLLYERAKANEPGAMGLLYAELVNMFEAFFVTKKGTELVNYRMYKKDAVQEFYFQLIKAVERYDVRKNIYFISYVFYAFNLAAEKYERFLNEKKSSRNEYTIYKSDVNAAEMIDLSEPFITQLEKKEEGEQIEIALKKQLEKLSKKELYVVVNRLGLFNNTKKQYKKIAILFEQEFKKNVTTSRLQQIFSTAMKKLGVDAKYIQYTDNERFLNDSYSTNYRKEGNYKKKYE